MKDVSTALPGLFRRAWRQLAGRPGTLRSQLVHGAVGSGGISVAKRLLLLATAILLARILGPDGYGVYAYASSFVAFLSVPAHFGLPNLIVREIAANLESRQWGRIRGLLHRAGQASLLFSTLTVAIGVVIGWSLSKQIEVLEWRTFVWALALIPLGAFAAVRTATLRGLHHVVKGQLPESLVRPVTFLSLVAASFLIFGPLKPHQVMMLAVVAITVAFLAGAWLLWRALPQELGNAVPQFETRKWFSSMLPFSFLAGIQLINSHADIIMLGFFTTPSDVGIYRVVSLGAMLVALPLITVDAVIAPKIASLHAKHDQIRLQRLMTASARYMLVFSVPVVFCLMLFGDSILTLIFGEQFAGGAMPLAILSLAQAINVGLGSVGVFLIMATHEADAARILTGAAVANILLNLVLIPSFGLIGAALATGVTLVSWKTCLALILDRKLKIRAGAVGKFR